MENDCVGFADYFNHFPAGNTIIFNFQLSIFNSLIRALNRNFPFDKRFLLFAQLFAIILSHLQDSYIGNTTASQAVKAGSTPVSCSKKRPPSGRSFLFGAGYKRSRKDGPGGLFVEEERRSDGGLS